MKTVQLTLSDEVLEQLEQATREQDRSPEEIIQLAIDRALRAHSREMLQPELERRDKEGYRRFPVRPGEFAIATHSFWPADPVEDAFWEKYYQTWLKEQEAAGNQVSEGTDAGNSMLDVEALLKSEVVQFARLRSDALVRKDLAALDRLLADEFVYTNAHGLVLSKASYLENYVVPTEIQWEQQAMDDVQVQLYGHTAVLTFRVHDVALFREQRFDRFFRSTFVWVKQDDAWRCVVGQTTAITEE